MQHAQDAGAQIGAGVVPLHDLVVGQPDGDGVDAEVPPRQVLLDRSAELDIGERTRPGVGLAARAGQVEREPVGEHGRRPEPIVDGQRAADALRRPARDRHRVTLDDEVEFARGAAQQRVAHGPADDVHAGLPGQGGEHGLGPRGRTQLVHGANVPLTRAANLQGP